jgi:hypothetical protein
VLNLLATVHDDYQVEFIQALWGGAYAAHAAQSIAAV